MSIPPAKRKTSFTSLRGIARRLNIPFKIGPTMTKGEAIRIVSEWVAKYEANDLSTVTNESPPLTQIKRLLQEVKRDGR